MADGNGQQTWGRRLVGGLTGLFGGGVGGAAQGAWRPPANTGTPATTPNPGVDRNDPQYRPGIGTRILRGAMDFMGGGAPGIVRGATNPNSPGYFGRGAVNQQYYRDLYQRPQPTDVTPNVNRPNVIPRYSGDEATATAPNPALPGGTNENFLDRLNWRVVPPGGGNMNPGPWTQ